MRTLIILGAVLFAGAVHADVLHLKNGREIENCLVLQESANNIVLTLGYGTVTLPRDKVGSIEKKPVDPALWPKPEPAQRIPDQLTVTKKLAEQAWATNLTQIPATVIDKGVLANVPYASFQCGGGYELNIYGDPDLPAGFEIGVAGTLVNDRNARSNCVAFIASMLSESDAEVVNSLNRRKDVFIRKDVTFEITPPSTEDSYGGWWVSVYQKGQLDAVRATPVEIKEITVAKAEVETPPKAMPTPSAAETDADDELSSWTPADIEKSRPAPTVGSGSGRVYVRGYYRKDGTYVRAHYRSRPKR
jgi:hypothetical protein